jgi:hypothetical protein
MLVAGAWLGWHMHGVRQQGASLAAVERLGGWAYYDYEVDANGHFKPEGVSSWPRPLVDLLGVDFFHSITVVNMVYSEDTGKRIENHNKTDEVLLYISNSAVKPSAELQAEFPNCRIDF